MAMAATLIFWMCVTVIFFAYAGFPIVLLCSSLFRNQRIEKKPITPSITLIIAAYNEEHCIVQKLENALELDYPPDALEIIVASDGSTDRTEAIVRERFGHRVTLLSLPRRGKIFALNDAIEHSTGEILAFSDANTILHPKALKKLVMNFADPQIGGVCGNQVYLHRDDQEHTTRGEKLYWDYDKWLKKLENRTGSIVAADGAVYAIRRKLFRVPASSAVTDDFAISTAVIEQGFRLVFEREALAFEKLSPGAKQEFRRKVRIMNRGLRAVMLRRALLNPFHFGIYSLTLFSHKILRRLVPFFLLVLFIVSIFLSTKAYPYLWFAAAQAVFYGWAAIGYLLRNTIAGTFKVFYIPAFYCLVNLAAAVAVLKLIAGQKIVLWEPQR